MGLLLLANRSGMGAPLPLQLTRVTGMRALLILVGVLMYLPALGADPVGLKGLRKIGLVIEDLNKNGADCGFTTAAIEASIRFIVQQSPIQIDPESALGGSYLGVAVTVLKSGGVCV